MNSIQIPNILISNQPQATKKQITSSQDTFEKALKNCNNETKAQDTSKTNVENNTQKDTKVNQKEEKENTKLIKNNKKITTQDDKKVGLEEQEKEDIAIVDFTVKLSTQEEQEIVDIITEKLGITPEELTTILNQLHIQVKDLLQNNNLQLMTKEVLNVSNIVQVLADPEKAKDVKEMFQSLKVLQESILDKQAAPIQNSVEVSKSEQQVSYQTTINQNNQSFNNQNQVVSTDETVELPQEKEIIINMNETNKESSQQQFNENSELKETKINTSKITFSANDSDELNGFIDNMAKQLHVNYDNKTEIIQEKHPQFDIIIKQVVDQIKINIKPEMTKMEFQLNPENLGKVAFSVISKEGLISARFVAENQMVKETIENQMSVLKQTLNDQGIKVDKIEVVVDSKDVFYHQNDEQSSREQHSSSKKSTKSNKSSLINSEEIEDTNTDYQIDQSAVNYIA